ncbi:hypothetical protein M2318_003504 [Metapseudomonas resinovorans]
MRLLGLREDQERVAKLAAELDRLFNACLPPPRLVSGRRRSGLQRRTLVDG